MLRWIFHVERNYCRWRSISFMNSFELLQTWIEGSVCKWRVAPDCANWRTDKNSHIYISFHNFTFNKYFCIHNHALLPLITTNACISLISISLSRPIVSLKCILPWVDSNLCEAKRLKSLVTSVRWNGRRALLETNQIISIPKSIAMLLQIKMTHV